MSFYLDSEHVALELFESWMQYINPLQTPDKQKNAYSRFAYPETYKERLHLTKYERDFKTGSKMSQYEFINIEDIDDLKSLKDNIYLKTK